jgi:two-component system, NarL family, response regulator DesR
VIRILLVEETGLWRGALATVLSQEDDLEIAAELAKIDKAIPFARAVLPDVAVVDIGPLSNDTDLAAVGEFSDALPYCAILVLADPAPPGPARGALGSHLRGLVGKDTGPRLLAQCIRRVAAGERVVDPALAVAAFCGTDNPLTARERELLRVATSGAPSIEIADRMHLSVGTVRNYLSMIMRKTGGRNRMEAVHLAQEAGWL